MNTETKVKDTITEEPKRIKIGKFYFNCNPLNLSQVVEIAELIKNNVKLDDKELDSTMISLSLNHPEYAETMKEVCLIAIFRTKFKRCVFGRYIKKNLCSEEYKAIFTHITEAFDYCFFLGSLIFLKNTTTKKREGDMTPETHIGD